jgi:Flp pilus assembly pilin Flp
MQAAWQAFLSAVRTIWDTVSGALSAAWSAVWNALKAAAQAIWSAMQAAWQAFLTAVKTIWDTISAALSAAWSAVWNALKAAAQAIWDAMKAAWNAFLTGVRAVWDTVSSALSASWSAVWNAMKAAGQAVWDAMKTAWSDIVHAFQSVWDTVSGSLKTAWEAVWNWVRDTAKRIWGDIQDAFKTPINFIIGGWDLIADVIHLPHINKLASGGEVHGPGTSTSDSVPALLSRGEYVVNAASVDHYGVDHFHALNARRLANGGQIPVGIPTGGSGFGAATPPPPGGRGRTSSSGLPPVAAQPVAPGQAMSGFGQVQKDQSLLGSLAAFASSAWDKLKSVAATAVYDMVKPILDGAVSAIPDPLPLIPAPAGSVPHSAAKAIVDGILAKLKSAQDAAKQAAAASGGGIGSSVPPVGDHKAVIDQALTAAGIPQQEWAKWEAGLNTIISRESSWNPNAINKTDSNAAAGHPSQGLMQTIPSTFAAYHAPGTSSNINDPVANIAAGIRYIQGRYGGIGNVQQANASAPPKGYWRGTEAAEPGWGIVGERGPEAMNFGGGGQSIRTFDETMAGMVNAARGGGPLTDHVSALVDEIRSGGLGGGEVSISMPVTVNGSSDPAGMVAAVESELVPKLRMLIKQGVGRN